MKRGESWPIDSLSYRAARNKNFENVFWIKASFHRDQRVLTAIHAPVSYGLINTCIAPTDGAGEPFPNNQVRLLPVESSNGEDESNPEHVLDGSGTRWHEEVMHFGLAKAEAGEDVHAMTQRQTQETAPRLHIDRLAA